MFLLHIPKIEDFSFLLPYPLTASHKSEYKIKKKKGGGGIPKANNLLK